MKELKKEQLLELGFEYAIFDGERCLLLCLNKGKDRKGETRNGVFIKAEDLHD